MGSIVSVTGETPEELWELINDVDWHKIEFEFVMEIPNSGSNGKFRFWIDDLLRAFYANVDYVPDGVGDHYFQSYGMGGNWSGANPDGSYYLDDVYIGTARPSGLSPDPPKNLRIVSPE